jgi:hypothetical protein
LVILLGIAFVLLFGLILIIVSSIKRKGKMGINLEKIVCPRCRRDIPSIRKPVNLRQFLWGGGTCKNCGCEVDKWGNEIQPS